MFDNKYKNLMNLISPDEALVKRTVAAVEQVRHGAAELTKETRRKHQKLRRRLIPAVAAILVAVITVSVIILSPTKNPLGFTIVASAATGDRKLSTEEFKPISDIAAAKSDSGFIGLDLSRLYADYDTLTIADEPVMIGECMFCLRVEGEDIRYVTFSLNKGKFEVSGNSVYKLVDYENKTEAYLGLEPEYSAFYDSITMLYSYQLELQDGPGVLYSDVLLRIPREYDAERDAERLKRFLNLSALRPGDPGELEPEEEFCSAYEDFINDLYRDTKIGVTVTYEDGHTKSVDLSLHAVCKINGKAVRRYRIAPGDDEDSFATCEIYDYTVTLNAKIADQP